MLLRSVALGESYARSYKHSSVRVDNTKAPAIERQLEAELERLWQSSLLALGYLVTGQRCQEMEHECMNEQA